MVWDRGYLLAGVKHPNIICDGCKCQGIQGIRWKCIKCYDYDLCAECYMADKHDANHPFLRFDFASSTGWAWVQFLQRY